MFLTHESVDPPLYNYRLGLFTFSVFHKCMIWYNDGGVYEELFNLQEARDIWRGTYGEGPSFEIHSSSL